MRRRVAFLRGINVGRAGRIAMADLARCTEKSGATEVRTVLATGNVVFSDPRPTGELREALESAYAAAFDYREMVHVLDLASVAAALEAYPFESLPQHHDYLVFSDDDEVTRRVVAEMSAVLDGQGSRVGRGTAAVAPGRGCLYWRMPRGQTVASAAGKILARSTYKRHLTTRNTNTLRRVVAVG